MAKYDYHTNFKGRACNIGSSAKFNKLTHKQRADLAFSKKNSAKRKGLTAIDNAFLQGYAKKTKELQTAYKFKHPKYRNKKHFA